MFTRDHAEAIAKKLKATIRSGSAHEIAIIEYQGQRITQFGIRRGLRRDIGHDHMLGAIHLRPRGAMLLAPCPMSYDEWISRMSEKGFIAVSQPEDSPSEE